MEQVKLFSERNQTDHIKIYEMEELAEAFGKIQADGYSVGIIGGCFDVLHIGHIELFRFAKSHMDYLCVILDNDETVRASKGDEHPVFRQDARANQLAELQSVDLVAIWDRLMPSGADDTDEIWHELLIKLRPDYHITNKDTDTFWQKKQQLCNKVGVKFLLSSEDRLGSSSDIIHKIMKYM